MEKHTFVFESLLWDKVFMGKIDNCISSFIIYGTVKTINIPQLVISIVELLQTKILNGRKKETLSLNDTYELMNLYREYIIGKIICEFNVEEFNKMYNSCIKLLTIVLKYSDDKKLSCF
jgi:hypothetical protein